MLSGLRFAKEGGAKAEKKSKKERRREKKKARKRKDKKQKAAAASSSSSADSSAAEAPAEVSQTEKVIGAGAVGLITKPGDASEDPKKTQESSGLKDEGDFFSKLGVERETKKNPNRPDPEEKKVHERELNLSLKGEELTQRAPISVTSSVPRHLTVGDGGSAWRRRAKMRAAAEAQAAAADKDGGTSAPVVRTRSKSRDNRQQGERRQSRRSRSRDRSRSRSRARRRDRSPDGAKEGTDAFGRSAGLRGRGANAATDWCKRDEKSKAKEPEDGAAEAEAVLRKMRSKYGGALADVEKDNVQQPTKPDEPPQEEPEDANELAALAMQAMLSGDMARYEELNKRVERKAAAMNSQPDVSSGRPNPNAERVEVIEEVDAAGRSRALVESVQSASVGTGQRGAKKLRGMANVGSGPKGKKEQGFYHDDDVSLDDLVRRTRIEGVTDYDANYAEHIVNTAKFKQLHEDDDEAYALGMYEDASKKVDAKKLAAKRQKQQISEKQRIKHNLQHCTLCMESRKFGFRKESVISSSGHAYLCFDTFKDCILPGQVFIAPQEHLPAATDLDENVWTEIRNYQKCLVRYFEAEDPPRAVIFAESSVHRVSREKLLMGGGPHTSIVAYPIPLASLPEARAYFKKAFDEAECEWSAQHKKVIPTTGKEGVRAAVPRHFPYVHVDFALGGGYAHVVEEAAEFPKDFVQETIAGMCELTILDRAYATKEAYGEAVRSMRELFKSKFDWTQA
mmetsp:Transcript_13206/g.21571  ORF Transcript_13206/g.21571 Transcript_13206/m.21571 type:complete len:737 (-) Transcript_13206:149-2359(-)